MNARKAKVLPVLFDLRLVANDRNRVLSAAPRVFDLGACNAANHTAAWLQARDVVGAPETEREARLVETLEDALYELASAREERDSKEEAAEDAENVKDERDSLRELLEEAHEESDSLRERIDELETALAKPKKEMDHGREKGRKRKVLR